VRLVVFWIVLAASAADLLETTFNQAVTALSTGDYAAAERGFQAVLKQAPNHLGALGNLGVVYSRADRPGDAVRIYERALKLAPKHPGLLLNVSLAYLKQEKHAAAKPYLERLLALDPGHAQGRELLAGVRVQTGEFEAGIRDLEQLPKTPGVLYTLSLGYMKAGRKDEARHTMEQLFSTAIEPAQAHFLNGKAYYESARFEEALEAHLKALDLNAKLPGLRLELGKTYVSLRRNDDAKRELTQATEPEAEYYLGALLVQEGDLAAGVPLLEKVRARQADFWGPYYYLGRARLEQKKPADAVRLLERAAELNPTESAVFYQLARAYKAAGRDVDARAASRRMAELRKR
jgi:predicted Zn-dependent protease